MVEKTLLNERILCFANRIKEYGIPYRFLIVIFLIWLLGTGTFFWACFILVKKGLHIYCTGFANCVDRMQKIDYNRIYVYRKFFNSQ